MDNSADLSTNDIEAVTMGNMLSNTNENDARTPATTINNGSENLEVNIPLNPVTPIENTACDTSITTKTDNSDSESMKTKPVASSSQEKISSNVDENMDMWLDGKTCELVKADNEEDFDVIVKSLETAIVETEHYESESIQGTVNSSFTSVNTESEEMDDSPMPSFMEMMEDKTNEIAAAVESITPTNPQIDYINQSANLFETQQSVPTLLKYQNEANATGPEIDPELSESSIVSASTEDNEEALLLNTTVESSESDFTLHLEEEHESEVPSTSKEHENKSQIEETTNKNEKSIVLNESTEIKIISVTSIVDYDDSSEEEEPISTEEEKCAGNNLHLVDNKSEEIIDATKIQEQVLDSTSILIENIEKDKLIVQESKDKIENTSEINTKEDDSQIIDQPEISSEAKSDPLKNTILKEIIEVKSADTNMTEPKKDIEIIDKDASTSDGAGAKHEFDQNLEIKNVAEKIIMSLDDSEEKPRAPPKKIKLIRQKLPNLLKSAPAKEKGNEQVIESEKSSPIEIKIFQESIKKADDVNVKFEEEKSDIKLEENFESDEKLFSDIFKIEDEVENKPVKKQKLKLKRNYVTPPVVCKTQVLHSSAKIAAVVKEPIKIIETVKQHVEAVKETELVTVVESIKESVKIIDVAKSTKMVESVKEEPVKESIKLIESTGEPICVPKKIAASVKESVKTVDPIEEFVKTDAPVEELVKIVTPVEELVKISAPVDASVKINTSVEESVKIAASVDACIKINAPVEEPAKIIAPVEELAKISASVEEPAKITAPVEEPVKITAPVDEPAKITAPVEEPAKITAPVEEPTKITAPIEEPAKIITPVEKSLQTTIPFEKTEKTATFVEESVKLTAPVKEPIKITQPLEEPVENTESVMEPVENTEALMEPIKLLEMPEFPKIDEAIKEPTKADETVEDPEQNNSIKEIFKLSVETIEPASKQINNEEEHSKIEEMANSLPEEVKDIEETDDLISEEVLEAVTKVVENKSEEIICETKDAQVENVTNVEIAENISDTSEPINSQEMIREMKDFDEVDKITQELDIIGSSLTDNLLKKDEIEPVKQTVQIQKEFGKIEEQNILEINEELQEQMIPSVEEILQVPEVLETRTKSPEPIISEPVVKNITTETIGKEIPTLVKDIVKKSDLIIETEKMMENLAETTTETENDVVEKTETITQIESMIEEIKVTEINQKVDIDNPVTKTEIRAFETIIPKTENLPKETNINLTCKVIEEKLSEKKPDNVEPIETEKKEAESKKIEEIQFPLLMSRLQDKLHANMSKSSKSLGKSFAAQADIQKAEKPVTIEPETTSNLKFRAMKRKHEPEHPARSITKPLTVEIDDLESSDAMMQPSEHENIPKLVIKQMPKQEQRSSPKITIKPIKPPGSPEVTSKRSKMSEDSPNTTRLTIKPLIKTDPLKITITKQKSDDTHSILKIYQPEEDPQHMDDTHVPKLTIKSIPKSEELQHSPKITIKPVKPPGSPKVTVKPILPPGDQHLERSHSPKVTVKPVINPEDTYPKVTIKPVLKPEETHKVTQISSRQVKLKSMTFDSSSGVTVEPICSTSSSSTPSEHENPMKISVKTFARIEESSSSPKLTIKPLTKTCEIVQSEDGTANPLKLTIKPILKPEESYQSPKITIKPIVKPDDHEQHTIIEEMVEKPERIILKIQKTNLPSPKERTSSHVRKEPEVKIEAIPPSYNPEHNQKLDKIKLKLTKEGSHAQIIPSITTSHAHTETNTSFSLKRTIPITNSGIQEKRQKSEFSELLHSSDISINIVEPHSRQNIKQISEEVTIMKIDKSSSHTGSAGIESITQMRLKEMLLKISQKPDITCTPHVKQIKQLQQLQQRHEDSSSSDDVRIVEVMEDPLRDPLNEDSSSQDVLIINEVIDTNPFKNVQIINAQTIVEPVQQQYTPKKRGRPRKVPLEVRPEIKGEDCILSEANNSAGESPEGGRPKRTCRAPAGRTPFAVKERKPRGSGRGRGSSRGVRGAKALNMPKLPKEPKSPRGKALKVAKALAKLEAAKLAQEVIIDAITIEDSTNDTPANTPIPQAESFLKKPDVGVEMQMQMQMQMVEPHKIEMKISEMTASISELADVKNTSMGEIKNTSVSVYEEETRMSASENNSRAQTPARQVFIVPLSAEGPEESQSSVQSSATTESTKNKKGRLEICDPDSAHTTVEQIVEYSWGNGGPYMLQEQIAQFLGVKSFKRKYPGLTRRPVDMQERDYIKEKGLVSESMCDMGLTAVPSSEILDIMYTDFQEKYEEYRKCLRDKQSKEISNKQKAISLATSQEKNKIDFKERAIRSTANWNATFNKSRKETRKCCMDLQTFTVNYPTGKNYPRVPHKNAVGSYPIALVPGQFTDYYKAYSTNELNYLPLNTVRYGPILPNQRCLEASDGSSESDSSSGSDSDSSDESMSTDDEAPSTPVPVSKHLTPLLATTPKTKVH